MKQGLNPTDASREAISRITKYYPTFNGAILAADKTGAYGMYLILYNNKFIHL